MKNDLENYLQRMLKEISDKKQRENSYIEMKSHFLDKVDFLIENGSSEKMAFKQVLDEATDPKKLGKKLNIAHRPLLLRYPIILGSSLFLIFSVSLLIYTSHYMVSKLLVSTSQFNIQKNTIFENKFFNDLKIIKKYEGIVTNKRSHNAHDYLKKNSVYYWDTGSFSKNPLEKILKQYRGWRSRPEITKKLIHNLPLKSLDLLWVDKLLDYDHLNFYSDEETKANFKLNTDATVFQKIAAISSARHANLLYLYKLILLRSLELITQKKEDKAKKVILKGFELFKNSSSFVGFTLGSQFLKFHNHINKTLSLGWDLIDESYILAIRRVPWGWTHLLWRHDINSEKMKRFSSFFNTGLGICAGLVENPLGPLAISGVFSNRFAFEPDFEERSQKYKEVARVLFSKCKLESHRKMIEGPFKVPELMDNQIWSTDGLDNLFFINPMALPYLRGIGMTYLYRVGIPQFNQIYFRD